MHGTEAPSIWIQRWSHLLAPACSALDVACGGGRHMQWLSTQGHAVLGIDRSAEALLLASKGGADMAKVREAITGGFADSRILQVHGQRRCETVPLATLAQQESLDRRELGAAQSHPVGRDDPALSACGARTAP